MPRSIRLLLLTFALILASGSSARAEFITFNWSGNPILGERDAFRPSGSAKFDITGNALTITLTNDSPQTMLAIGEVLSALTWQITDPAVKLSKGKAMIALDSRLVGVGATADIDLSKEWAFRSNISAGFTPLGTAIGPFGIGSVGDINFGKDTFGAPDRFDTSGNLWGPSSGSLNGIDAGIVGPTVNLSSDGFTSQGPVVQGWKDGKTGPGQMIFTFTITAGTLSVSEITGVEPLFGTDGAPLVPEPSSFILLALGGLSLAGYRCLRKRSSRVPACAA